jgi:hypothetical protein
MVEDTVEGRCDPDKIFGSVELLLAAILYQRVLMGTTSSGIYYQLRDICRCCWNVATYK